MKMLKQFGIILLISLCGELLKHLLPFSIPASIYGMAVLFGCLVTGAVKLEDVREAGRFLIEIMPVMFIPAGVGVMASWGVLQPVLVPVSVITVAAIITVMGVTGRVSQRIVQMDRNACRRRPETEKMRQGKKPFSGYRNSRRP